jgi:WD40 repeat protein
MIHLKNSLHGTICLLTICVHFFNHGIETNYAITSHKTECPRSQAIASLHIFPAVIVECIRAYEKIVLRHSVNINIAVEQFITHDPSASAFALLPQNRIVIAHRKGSFSIIDYMTAKTLHTWQSLQREVEQIDTVSYSEKPKDARIISIAPITCSMRVWNGEGKALYSTINRYACNPFHPMPSTFDAMTIATSNSLGGINGFILSRTGSPFSILRTMCKHILYLSPASIVAGFRSGSLEHWRYNFKSPSVLWRHTILNQDYINTNHAKPITALCRISEYLFLAGFPDGIIQLWSIKDGLKKMWKAHEENIKNINILNKDICITTADKVLKTWQLPRYEEGMTLNLHAPILNVLTTNNPCSTNYVILCFEEEPLQVWSC